jgi:tryptophanyl-tRNA synthetase
VAEAVVGLLAPIQERYRELRAADADLRRLLALGAEKAAAEAEPTLAQMYERMGFVRLT